MMLTNKSKYDRQVWLENRGSGEDRPCLSVNPKTIKNCEKITDLRKKYGEEYKTLYGGRYELLPAGLYFLNNRYFTIFGDCGKLERNKVIPTKEDNALSYTIGYRPYVYAFTDKMGLAWMIPLSGRVDKYKGILRRLKKNKTGISSPHILFGYIDGQEAALLIQNMCPVKPEYIYCPALSENHHIGEQVFLDNNLSRKALLFAKLAYRNTKTEIDMGLPLSKRSILTPVEIIEQKLIEMDLGKYREIEYLYNPLKLDKELDRQSWAFDSDLSEQKSVLDIYSSNMYDYEPER